MWEFVYSLLNEWARLCSRLGRNESWKKKSFFFSLAHFHFFIHVKVSPLAIWRRHVTKKCNNTELASSLSSDLPGRLVKRPMIGYDINDRIDVTPCSSFRFMNLQVIFHLWFSLHNSVGNSGKKAPSEQTNNKRKQRVFRTFFEWVSMWFG